MMENDDDCQFIASYKVLGLFIQHIFHTFALTAYENLFQSNEYIERNLICFRQKREKNRLMRTDQGNV